MQYLVYAVRRAVLQVALLVAIAVVHGRVVPSSLLGHLPLNGQVDVCVAAGPDLREGRRSLRSTTWGGAPVHAHYDPARTSPLILSTSCAAASSSPVSFLVGPFFVAAFFVAAPLVFLADPFCTVAFVAAGGMAPEGTSEGRAQDSLFYFELL
jgi:hypothetical protein